MKFGNYLKEHMQSPWRLEYIQYDLLKMDLKNRQLDHEWNQQDEQAFIQLFSNEKNKVVQFIHNFSQQLVSRIKYSQHLLQNARKNNVAIPQDMRFSQLPPVKDSTADFLNTLDDTLIDILFDIHDFSRFIHLNHIGFEKILKKHKKWTHIDHQKAGENPPEDYHHDIASLEINHNHSFYKQVSALRYQCRHDIYKANQLPCKQPDAIPLIVPERRSTKYWIHQDHISEVTAILCMYSYIIPKSPVSSDDSAMSNLYFDNGYMDIYSDRVDDKENTQVVKCKRYGSFSNDPVYYFENEIHNSFYSGDVSSKSRFKINQHDMSDFFQGKYTVPDITDDADLDEKEAMKLDYDNPGALAKATQDGIHSRSLKPLLQCNYNRLTFEPPNNNDKLVITLDTDIEFHQQYDIQDFAAPPNTETQRSRFPYAILEVKLSTDSRMDDPSLYWLNAFTQKSKLLHQVPKFSKYLQGAHQVFSSQDSFIAQDKVPSWLGFYQKGITASVQHQGLSRSRSLRPLLNGKKVRSIIPYTNASSRASSLNPSCQKYHDSSVRSSQSNSEYVSLSLNIPSNDANLARSAIVVQNENPKIVLDMNEKTEMHSPAMDNSAKSSSSFSRQGDWISNNTVSNNSSTGNLILDQDGYPIVYKNQSQHYRPQQAFFYNKTTSSKDDIETGFKTQQKRPKNKKNGKKSSIKLEPKVFFANERTFISWLQFCALLLTVALNLLNFGDKISRICGGVFLFISMLLALYALARFQYRAWQLRRPHQTGRFDDLYGPAVLCILIVAALVINFWLRFRYLPDANDKSTYLQSSANTTS